MKTPLYKRVAKAIEQDCIDNELKHLGTNRYYDFRHYPHRKKRYLPIECSYSTLMRAFEYLIKTGKMRAFGNAHTVTLYLYMPNLIKWANEQEYYG